MIRYRDASNANSLLVILSLASLLPLHVTSLVDSLAPEDGGRSVKEWWSTLQEKEENAVIGEVKDNNLDDELFRDVDPKMLAAVLLEALNKPSSERKSEEGESGETEKIREGEEKEGEGLTMKEQNVSGASGNLARDGREELELVMAAKALRGKEEHGQEEEERQKAKEEEEKLTEKVKSRTTSQTVPVKIELHSATPDTGGEQVPGKEEETGVKEEDATAQQSPKTPSNPKNEGMQHNQEEEEQLSPEELKNLETMMKEFQSFSTASKQERDSLKGRRESRGYAPYKDVLPKNKGYELAMSKKKLKWQEETQKAMNVPRFWGGNFMDDFEENLLNVTDSISAQPLSLLDNKLIEDDEPEEAEDEALSPEEEEARAKAEQEEVQRQAVEAQRAKMEEEKLADIASDMLLQYMVKENSRKRKYNDQKRKYISTPMTSISNTAEDKRSDEEQDTLEEDDDIDSQTIDKLIEISSKLHLPADDVVDIISDVEKKKKKDVAPETALMSLWKLPPMTPSSLSFTSTRGSQIPANHNSLPSSKQALPAVNPLQVWFQEKQPLKSSLSNQDLLLQMPKSQSTNQNYLLKLQKPLSNNPDVWLKPQKSFRTSYLPYSPYSSFYPKKTYQGYYPVYLSPPKLKSHYYIPKPALTLDNLLGNSADYSYNISPKRHFRNWIQPRPRKPPTSFQNSYYPNFVFSSYPRTFQPFPIPKQRSPPRLAGIPAQQNKFYYSPPVPVTRDENYYGMQIRNQADKNNDEDLESFIQQILTKRPLKFK